LAVIWRTWPQILSPFTIWAVLSWLQGGHSFRSCCAPQVRLLPAKVRLTLTSSHPQYLSIFRIHFVQRVTWWLVGLFKVGAFFSFLFFWYTSALIIYFCRYTFTMVYRTSMYKVLFCKYTFTMAYRTSMYEVQNIHVHSTFLWVHFYDGIQNIHVWSTKHTCILYFSWPVASSPIVTASRFGILCIIQFAMQLNSSSLFMPLIGLFNLLASFKPTQQNVFLKVELFL